MCKRFEGILALAIVVVICGCQHASRSLPEVKAAAALTPAATMTWMTPVPASLAIATLTHTASPSTTPSATGARRPRPLATVRAHPTRSFTRSLRVTGTPTPPRAHYFLVALDPGHGGIDWGAIHFDDMGEIDFYESHANLEIALRLAVLLGEEGFGVVLTREDDKLPNEAGEDLNGDGVVNIYDDLQKRVDIVNAAGADIVLSIHLNGFEDQDDELVRKTGGTVTFYCQDREFADKNRLLAELVQRHILQVLAESGYDSLDRGALPDDALSEPWEPVQHFILLGPCWDRCLRPSQMPGVIGESLFVTNQEEVSLLQRHDILEQLAIGYLNAIKEYYAQVMQVGDGH